jgi:hypothetical protein
MVAEDSRRTWKVLGDFNSIFLSIIHKKENPTSFYDSWPISLYNYFIYNIIEKIIIVRVKKIFLKRNSKEQFIFLQGMANP